MKTITTFWQLLSRYLRQQKRDLFLLTGALLSSICLQIVNPQILRFFIDMALSDDVDSGQLYWAAGAFLGIALVTQVLTVAATYWGELVAWTATNALRFDLAAHCLQLDMRFHKKMTPGMLIQRIDGDVQYLSRFFSRFTIMILGNSLLLVGILGALVWEEVGIGVGMGIFTVVTLLILVRLRGLSIPYWERYEEMAAQFYGFIGEQLAGLPDIQANGAVPYVLNRFYRLNQKWLPLFHKARLSSTVLWGASIVLFATGHALSLALAAYFWAQGELSLGTVFLVFYYSNLLIKPINDIRDELEILQQAEAAIQRISELQGYESSLVVADETHLPAGALGVEVVDIGFAYEDDPPLFTNFSWTLPAGQTVGILGRTGSGKTSLARLLARLYDPQAGAIRLGGVDIRRVGMAELMNRVGMVTQQVQLFQGTVRQNLTFFDETVDDGRLEEALKALELWEWVQKLPRGLDTMLGADGLGLSAGEAQLLAFTRVFLKDPGLVILDEASSRLDPETEALLEAAVTRLLTGRTGVIIAHRLATVSRVDRILILAEGEIVEEGVRAELVDNPDSVLAGFLGAGQASLDEEVTA
ncbi:MAG TPA: ABC transporter ATP-binding protein [Anaerolineae bacterium]|nr:ABC transporter ATP-binding protein [Anaerolineae bacterium]